jgi:hypothetical protein
LNGIKNNCAAKAATLKISSDFPAGFLADRSAEFSNTALELWRRAKTGRTTRNRKGEVNMDINKTRQAISLANDHESAGRHGLRSMSARSPGLTGARTAPAHPACPGLG